MFMATNQLTRCIMTIKITPFHIHWPDTKAKLKEKDESASCICIFGQCNMLQI